MYNIQCKGKGRKILTQPWILNFHDSESEVHDTGSYHVIWMIVES